MEVLNSIHFLRPWWFLALLPIAWIILRAWQANRKQGAWHKVIDPKFRSLLLGENSSTEPSFNEKMGYIGLSIAWIFAILALSGPWIKSIEVPAQKNQQGVVIVLDLSLSMLADDLSPNRISRVKYKITDLLKQHPEYATGMVAYAGSAHTISPISEDNKTLLGLLPSLNPVMMPNYGAKPILGFEQASKLFKGANITQGHILWITDDIEEDEITQVSDWVKSHSYSMTVMTVGTDTGGVVQIPNYGLLKDNENKLIMPKLPIQRFEKLSQETNIKWVRLIPGEQDVQALLPPKLASTEDSADDQHKKEVKHPLDIGAYFLFIIIPLVAFIFRRGTLLSLTLIVVTPASLFTPQPSYAKEWLSELPALSSMFKSPDQQGYDAWEEKKYEAASALFENAQWRASALYRQGKYAEAAKLFALDKSPVGHYNQGNALALSGNLQEAAKAYEKALQLDPDFKEAQSNLAVVNNLLNQQSPQNNGQNQQGQQNEKADNTQDKQPGEPQKNTVSDKQNQQSSPSYNTGNNQENASKQQNTDQASQSEQGKKDVNSEPSMNGKNSNQPNGNGKADNNLSKDNQDGKKHNQATQANHSNTADNDLNQPALAEDGQSSNQDENHTDQSAKEQKNAAPSKLNSDSPNNPDQQSVNADGTGNQPKLTEDEQARQNWLKQIPDQPGLFLKRKFEYQFQQNPRNDKPAEKQW
ncbi:hypothetical protein THMIRHAM_00620 [Thiomicrorhabdus immobilis]|uniref:VWFA domain-containing protein n=1 Tax=Thiomicrorhabdus immobilis TaxID=2791037 RepID=A0ABM7MAC2_9GAMM|nr:VWA domain-containing protein [Thiomicrorhabdus immobilis]BCN92277.1 hypothetical protein THMIRHAM_00620 [Thiomicrorhabdus immobilis]